MNHFYRFLIPFVCLISSLANLNGQSAIHALGGDDSGSGGVSSFSVGQTLYVTHSTSSGIVSEGVQQITCPGVTAPDTAGCPGAVLSMMIPDEDGGSWEVLSSIGSTVDTSGVVTLGYHTALTEDLDTVLYLLNGCTTEVVVTVYPPARAVAINGGPYCPGELAHLYETGGNAISWLWSFPSGFSSNSKNPKISPVVPGDYAVSVVDANGCTASDTTTVCVSSVSEACETTVDVYLNDIGQAVFDPSTLSASSEGGGCQNVVVVPSSVVTYTCADVGGAGFSFSVSDDVGCVDQCDISVSVKDTTRPEENCQSVNNLVLVWESSEVFPSSLADLSEDNCGAGGLEFSFSEDFTTPSLDFNCREKLLGPIDLEIYIKDQSGNVTTCTVSQVYAPESEDCDCQDLYLDFPGTVPAADHKAKYRVTSSGTVNQGDTVLFKAEQSILLEAGFHAREGSVFGARIDSCDASVVSSRQPDDADIENTKGANEGSTAGLHPVISPNPFTNMFALEFDLADPQVVSLTMHHTSGNRLLQLFRNRPMESGNHRLTLDGSKLIPGVYYLTLSAGTQRETVKVIKVR